MRVGMLWFDSNKERELDAKIDKAARHYETKYGIRPTICYVHPTMLKKSVEVPGIDIRSTDMVLPNHLWLGKNEDD